jgi:hypothetical protein
VLAAASNEISRADAFQVTAEATSNPATESVMRIGVCR